MAFTGIAEHNLRMTLGPGAGGTNGGEPLPKRSSPPVARSHARPCNEYAPFGTNQEGDGVVIYGALETTAPLVRVRDSATDRLRRPGEPVDVELAEVGLSPGERGGEISLPPPARARRFLLLAGLGSAPSERRTEP